MAEIRALGLNQQEPKQKTDMKTTAINPHSPGGPPPDGIIWTSADDQVRIRRRVSSAGRWPQHGYPIITLDVKPQEGTRIRFIEGGERVDLCLTHAEQLALAAALNTADPSVQYGLPARVPSKPPQRKAHYDRLNARRWAKKRHKE